MAEYFYRKSGRVIGPISWQNVETLCQRGLIDLSTKIQKDGGRWKRAIDYDRLEAFFEIDDSLDSPQNASRQTVSTNHADPTSFTKPPKEQQLVISQLYTEPDSAKPLPFQSQKNEEGTSFVSIAIVVILGIGIHACIFMNYGNIEAYVKGLMSGGDQVVRNAIAEKQDVKPPVQPPNRNLVPANSDTAKPITSKSRSKLAPAKKPRANNRDIVNQSDVEVRVIDATLGAVSLKQASDDKGIPVFIQPLMQNEDGVLLSEVAFLCVRISVANKSELQTMNYRTWGSHGRAQLATEVRLVDDTGKQLDMVKFGNDLIPADAVITDSIEPGEITHDILVFKPPSGDVKSLSLYLPASHVDGEGVIKIEIPSINRTSR